MPKKLVKYKPGVKRKTHLLITAVIWPLIGIMLSCRGLSRVIGSGYYWLIIVGIVVGSLKSYFILDKTARKGIDRILRFGDNTCIGAVYSIKTWGMVFGMIGMGIIFRNSSFPPHLLGALYITIGWGLLMSSRHAWITWYRLVTQAQVKENNKDIQEDA